MPNHKGIGFKFPLTPDAGEECGVRQLSRDFDPVWNHFDLGRFKARAHQQVSDKARHRDDSVASAPVLQAVKLQRLSEAPGQESHPACSHSLRPESERCQRAHGLTPTVMRVKDVKTRGLQFAA